MNQQIQQKDEIDLIDYIRVVCRRWWIILIVVIISMLNTGVSSMRQAEAYKATATFFPINISYSAQSESFIMKPRFNIEDFIISILESERMSSRIVEQLNLKELWNMKYKSSAQGALKGATTITLGKRGLIELSIVNSSAKLSAEIANAYVDNLEYFNQQFDVGAQKQIAQVIDRATVPECRMARGTVKKTMRAGSISFIFAIFLVIFIESIRKSDIIRRLREK